MSPSTEQALQRYIAARAALRQMPGWFDPLSEVAAVALSRAQSRAGVFGNLCEIGIHMGRSFIPLLLTLANGEKGVAIDLFSQQHLNVDHSGGGEGDAAKFMRNVSAAGGRADDVKIIESSSLELTASRILNFGPVRFFSIDGGHTAQITCNDLELAEQCLGDRGVAMLDDCFNQDWPGVVTGYGGFRPTASGGRLVPFAITPNKVFLSRPAAASDYRRLLRAALGNAYYRTDALFGHELDIYRLNLYDVPRRLAALRRVVLWLDRVSARLRAYYLPRVPH